MLLKSIIAFSLFISTSAALASSSEPAGKVVMDIVDIITQDNSDSEFIFSEGLAIWIKESARIGNAKFVFDKKTKKPQSIEFKLASASELRSTLSAADFKTLNDEAYNDEAVGKAMNIEVVRSSNAKKEDIFIARFIAVDSFGKDEPKGTVLVGFIVTMDSANKIQTTFRNAMGFENNSVIPRGISN